MLDGFFSMAFTGSAGSGFGVIALHNGKVAGSDVAGASYDGSYQEDPDTHVVNFDITMSAPAGLTPVQTGVPLAAPQSIPISMSVSADDLTGDLPTRLRTPLGPVNVLFRKIRDYPPIDGPS
jgi:hypothetical protein